MTSILSRALRALAAVALLSLAACAKPAGPVVLLGDSLTESLPPDTFPGAVNYGVAGIRTDQLLERIPRMPRVRGARLVVLTIGTNDIYRQRVAGVEGRMRAISQAIPGPVLWNAVPPTAFGARDRVNAAARKVCAERPDCVFLETRFQPGDFTDGTHLSPAGYARWAANLRRAARAL